MIGSVNTGGGATAFAFIVATYPVGSTCTCTCTETGKVLRAKDTSGSWVFEIPYTGTWTVSIGALFSKDVIISAKGESKNVNLTIPTIYQKVEYLEVSTANKVYFDTGVVPTNHCIEMKFKTLTSGTATRIFGQNISSQGANNFYCGMYQSRLYAAIIDGAEKNLSSMSANTIYELLYNYGDNHQVILSGSTILASATSITCAANEHLSIFRATNQGAGVGMRVYYFNIIDRSSNLYVRKMFPVYLKSDQSVVGLYDIVSQTLFRNESTGTIIVGGDVE